MQHGEARHCHLSVSIHLCVTLVSYVLREFIDNEIHFTVYNREMFWAKFPILNLGVHPLNVAQLEGENWSSNP